MQDTANLSAGEVLPVSADSKEVVAKAQGLLGEVLELEAGADELSQKAKDLNKEAGEKRDQIKAMLQGIEIKSIKHNSGYTVLLAQEKKFKFPAEDKIMAGLKKLNWLPLYTEVIPEHVEPARTVIDTKKLTADLKKNPAAISYFKGLEVEDTETLKIIKPKE